MKKYGWMFKGIAAVVLVMLICIMAPLAFGDLQSKYATGTTSAAVTFGPGGGVSVVKGLFASSDKLNSVAKIYARSGNKVKPSSAQSVVGTTILMTNTGYAFTNSDSVVVSHANGTVDYRTVSSATLTSIVVNANTSYALTTEGRVYEVSQQGEMLIGYKPTATSTNALLNLSGDLFATPGDSPIYIVVDGTAACKVTATVDK